MTHEEVLTKLATQDDQILAHVVALGKIVEVMIDRVNLLDKRVKELEAKQ